MSLACALRNKLIRSNLRIRDCVCELIGDGQEKELSSHNGDKGPH